MGSTGSTAVEAATETYAERWRQLVCGIFCMVMIANLQYGWTLFVHPIDQKFHWGTTARPRYEWDVGRIFLAPAQLEQIVSGLDHDGFPPRRPSALGFGQHEMADIDVVPIFGQRLGVGGEFCRDRFIVFCLA